MLKITAQLLNNEEVNANLKYIKECAIRISQEPALEYDSTIDSFLEDVIEYMDRIYLQINQRQ